MIDIKKNKHKKHGFTLVELIIVIAIIAILAAIAIPKFGEMRKTANIKADIATAKNIATIVSEQLAENKIAVSQKNKEITALSPSSGSIAVSIVGNLDGAITPKVAAKDAGSTFTVSIDATGNITVFVGTTEEIYPELKVGSAAATSSTSNHVQ